MATARAHRKFAIYSGFLDTILEGEEEILEGETRKDTLKRIIKELEETAAELKLQAHPGEDKTGGGSHTVSPQQGPEVIDYKKWERFEIDIDNAETSDELELIIKQVDTFPGRLLSTINAKRQALKPKEFTDGLE